MPDTPSTRWAIERPADTDLINAWPTEMRAALDKIDQFMAGIIEDDPRPAAAVFGRFHRHPTTGVVSFDTGASWIEMSQNPHAALHAEGGDDPLPGQVPIGAVLPYAGSTLPPNGAYAWADGSLIDRTTYAEFFNRVGHAYNGGVDPGTNKVRVPDKRGRVAMGADNFGVGAANRLPNETAAGRGARGTSGGEERHTLTTAELAAHSHPASSGTESADHTHSGSTDTQGSHTHVDGGNGFLPGQNSQGWGGFFAASGGGGSVTALYWGGTNSAGSHAHNFGTGGRSAAHTHAITVSNNTGGGGAHQNLQPYEADNYIVRIA